MSRLGLIATHVAVSTLGTVTPVLAAPSPEIWQVSQANKGIDRTALWRGSASFVLPGTGQFLNADSLKGWTHLGTGVVLGGGSLAIGRLAADSRQNLGDGGNFLGLFLVLVNAGFHLYSALDAYQVSTSNRPAGGPF